MADTHVRAWRALEVDVRVHSRHDPSRFATEHGIPAVADLDELIDRCDVVDVCTPTPSHEPLVLAAVEAGRQVVCEKPLARSARTAQRLADAARDAGVLLFPAHVVRYFPAYDDVRRRVLAGEVGAVRSVDLSREVARPADGSWFHDTAASGGVAFDLMIHDLDQALWLLGPVEEVSARAVDAAGERVRATLRHVEGGTSTVEAWWGPADTVFATRVAVHGGAGSIEHDSRRAENAGDDPLAPYVEQLRDVLAHLRTGAPTRVTTQEGVAAVALAERVLDALGAPS
jgi:myo-inositol 2-dehydrogenase/D-chiro-inositol 1-dehydrogenase